MLAAVALFAVAVIFTLAVLAEQLVRFIPFEVEQSLAERFINSELSVDNGGDEAPQQQQIEDYLQQLADQLNKADSSLYSDDIDRLPITVHYVDSDEINAFATLGGHILIFRGLLEHMPNENALAMVLGHEIAHIQHRDPIVALGRGLTIGVAMMSIAGIGDGAMSEQLLSHVATLSHLSFSRAHEQEADDSALHTLSQYYGHVGAADSLFTILLEQQNGSQPPIFFSTHPLNKDRITRIQQHPGYRSDATLTPLPDWLNAAIEPPSER